jgi:predicted adenylyl cyclase CyaB
MSHVNYEIKARCSEEKQNEIREILNKNYALFNGEDYQTDIYFKIEKGRLKLRKGKIENALIYYERENKEESKKSDVIIFRNQGKLDVLEDIIKKTHDILIEVEKKREIYFIDNVKFHLDDVKNLGKFMEIEAISENTFLTLEKIKKQCDYYTNLFGIKKEDLIKDSYSDMLLELNMRK